MYRTIIQILHSCPAFFFIWEEVLYSVAHAIFTIPFTYFHTTELLAYQVVSSKVQRSKPQKGTPSPFTMEDQRQGKPVAVIGGMYAKAKQRVLNKMGRRTSTLSSAFNFLHSCFVYYSYPIHLQPL